MPGRRRGARTGRGWDAAPARSRPAKPAGRSRGNESGDDDRWADDPRDAPLWFGEEETYTRPGEPVRDEAGWPAAPGGEPGRVSAGRPGGPGRDGAGWPEAPRGGPGRDGAGWPEAPRGGPGRDGADRPRASRGEPGQEPAERPGTPLDELRRALAGRSRRTSEQDPPLRPGEPEPAPEELAREICLRQLAVRPRTRAELATALRKHGIADEVANAVLDRYDEVGIIDDAAFARAWVTSRHHGRGLARRALASELRQKGVDGELVGEALTEVDGDTEAATARSLVDRKLRSMSSAPPDAAFRRLVGMLARKGYPPGLAVRVVKDALADRDAEAAAFADLVDPDAMPGLVGDSDDPIR